MTDRISAPDAALLSAEDGSAPQHTGGVVLLAPGPADEKYSYQAIVDLIESRLALVPRYRQRVKAIPGRLARPVWVDDENFDLNYHVRRSALPRPGSMEQLDELVGRLISRPLEMQRPLWELYVVEGLAGGRVALVNKTHQALMDRMGTLDITTAILDETPQAGPPTFTPWTPAPAPGDATLVADALADLVTHPSTVLELLQLGSTDVGTVFRRLARLADHSAQLVRRTLLPAPRSVLSVANGGQRRYSTHRVELADLKAIRAAHGGSLHDVIITVITGALRTWLLSHGQAVTSTTSLRALVPVSARPGAPVVADESWQDGTAPIRSVLVDLPVAEPNPVMRLHQVSFTMAAWLDNAGSLSADALLGLGKWAPPTLHALGARMAGQLSGRMYNVLVTNVPGPQRPLYAGQRRVLAMYPVAPLQRQQALAVAVTSYDGGVFFGVTGDREAVPDIEEFADHLGDAVTELQPPPARRRSRRPSGGDRSATGAAGSGDRTV